MATINTINIGNVVNDGLGDDLRTAFQKVNANFASLGDELTITASNLGVSGASIFKQKVGTTLEFRKLEPGTKIFLDETDEKIIISSEVPDAFRRIETQGGTIVAGPSNNFGEITIQGGNDIDVTAFGSVITVNTVIPITSIIRSFDFGPITGEFETTTQLALAAANIDFGTIEEPSRFNLDCGGII